MGVILSFNSLINNPYFSKMIYPVDIQKSFVLNNNPYFKIQLDPVTCISVNIQKQVQIKKGEIKTFLVKDLVSQLNISNSPTSLNPLVVTPYEQSFFISKSVFPSLMIGDEISVFRESENIYKINLEERTLFSIEDLNEHSEKLEKMCVQHWGSYIASLAYTGYPPDVLCESVDDVLKLYQEVESMILEGQINKDHLQVLKDDMSFAKAILRNYQLNKDVADLIEGYCRLS